MSDDLSGIADQVHRDQSAMLARGAARVADPDEYERVTRSAEREAATSPEDAADREVMALDREFVDRALHAWQQHVPGVTRDEVEALLPLVRRGRLRGLVDAYRAGKAAR